MSAYYNEIDPFAAQWLRELIAENLIAKGDVDERSIEDIKPSELKGYKQCHFFAGIGVWSYALKQTGWPDDKPVWTGSCPCQPFSEAGERKGFDDERHLWPAWQHLIEQCRPRAIFGEQVASKDGLAWLDVVQADLEATDYTSAAVDLCAAGVGAPHIRQRLWFVAYSNSSRSQGRLPRWEDKEWENQHGLLGCDGTAGSLANTSSDRCTGCCEVAAIKKRPQSKHSKRRQLQERSERLSLFDIKQSAISGNNKARRPCSVNGFWSDADWIRCQGGKFRPVEPGTFPLVDGASARVGRLRGYGNAINAEVAKTFISACISYEKNSLES